ncbi:antibiotic biosynthesis monooxygenase family protein [Shimazuella kribbensis]|uniref:antibiotic biosynthesis monooxygenase family protein n=1 Tax=Shimazuella kribbensis TaxID=139808 RepID=UPI00041865D1|nr:antibiotic biosynthesis monooxygenase family protein [Shimazuella kribbensis]
MVVEIIRLNIEKESLEKFQSAFQEVGGFLQRSEHCLSFEVLNGVEEPNHFIIKSEWDSLEGHQAFETGPDAKDFFALVEPFFPAILEKKHYNYIAKA